MLPLALGRMVMLSGFAAWHLGRPLALSGDYGGLFRAVRGVFIWGAFGLVAPL